MRARLLMEKRRAAHLLSAISDLESTGLAAVDDRNVGSMMLITAVPGGLDG